MPPVVNSIYDISDKAKMELKSWLEPFFRQRGDNKGSGSSTTTSVAGRGALNYRKISLASTNGDLIKSKAATVYGWFLSNQNAATRYIKLYNQVGSPTVGTDVPFMTIAIPGGASANMAFDTGVAFGAGLAIAMTTGNTDADTGAVAANDVIVNIFYA